MEIFGEKLKNLRLENRFKKSHVVGNFHSVPGKTNTRQIFFKIDVYHEIHIIMFLTGKT